MEDKKTKKSAKDTVANTKDEALSKALKEIEKQYGKGAIMKLGDRGAVDVDAISSSEVFQKAESLKSTVLNQAERRP